MKFRNPRTGESFNSITTARRIFCSDRCCERCSLPNTTKLKLILPNDSLSCSDFCEKHPIEATDMMGYEVILEPGDDTSITNDTVGALAKLKREVSRDILKKVSIDRPMICTILGVEVGERFRTNINSQYHITEGGAFLDDFGNYPNASVLCDLIEHPDHIIHEELCFTKQDVDDAKNIKHILKADFVQRSINGSRLTAIKSDTNTSITINPEMFPAIKPGQSYTLDEIIRCSV